MRVPPRRTSRSTGAHALQSAGDMPRKQRFKPSRKPQNQATVSNPQVDDRKEIHRQGHDIERQAPAEQVPRDIETEQA